MVKKVPQYRGVFSVVISLNWIIISSLWCFPGRTQPSSLDPIPPLEPYPDFQYQDDQLSTETEYTLGAGDVIRVTVFPVEEFTGEYQVLVDGTLSLPLLGTFPVQGLTLTQLTEFLTQQYIQYVKRPSVTVGLVSPRP